jgi:Leucine-rich repeat (LRR) protein
MIAAMNNLFFILVMLLAQQVSAQIHVWSSEEAKAANFHPDRLPLTYEEKSNDEAMDLIHKSFNAVIAEDVDPGIMVITEILINGQGSVDYVIFDLQTKGYNTDSINQILKKSLVQSTANWKLTKQPEKPIQITMLTTYGKRIVNREVRQTDSSVINLKDAQACIDTLKIKKIFFNQLELKTVPDVIYRFPNAEELYLGGNSIKKAFIDLKKLPRLKQLFVDGNLLTNESFTLSNNKSLELLNLKENKFTNIPKAVRKCKKMTSLMLGGNKLTHLSNRSFRKLKQVRDLNFYRSELAVLPKGIQKMKNLEVLDLYYNQLEVLPDAIVKLSKLAQLAISYNQLKTLPQNINRLQNVHTLYAHHNKLSELPDNISKMQKIRILDLGYNAFNTFPAEIAFLDSLQELDISSNHLVEFPSTLLEMKKLDKLYLRGNPFVDKNMEKKYANQLGVLKGRNVEVFY